MTVTQAGLFLGAVAAAGISCIIAGLLRPRPDLGSALDRLAPTDLHTGPAPLSHPLGRRDRVGAWAMTRLPAALTRTTTAQDLDLIGWPVHRFYATKTVAAVAGLVVPAVLGLVLIVSGFGSVVLIPAVAGLVLAVAGWFLPDLIARDRAVAARLQFTQAVAAYLEMVALARVAAAGTRAAMTAGAQVVDSWPFRRISQELELSSYAGTPPWTALRTLGTQLQVPALTGVGDVMSLAGESGAAVHTALRARAAALRSALLTTAQDQANATTERMTMPGMAMAAIFIALLVAPALLRITGLA